MITKLYFVRHGESEANAAGILAGQQDSPVTNNGLRQAHDVARLIREEGLLFDRLITSPLSRAYDTAKIIAEKNDLPVQDIVVLDSIMEKYSGGFEGRAPAEMFAASEDEMRQAGGETFQDFYERVGRANEEIIQRAAGTTLIVGHAEFYRMAECVMRGWSADRIHETLRPDNGRLLEYPLHLR